jgi:hypothetical protein
MSEYVKQVLSEIEDFLSETGMSPSYFGKIAVGNSEVVKRLRIGRRVWPETAQAARNFIAEYRSKSVDR